MGLREKQGSWAPWTALPGCPSTCSPCPGGGRRWRQMGSPTPWNHNMAQSQVPSLPSCKLTTCMGTWGESSQSKGRHGVWEGRASHCGQSDSKGWGWLCPFSAAQGSMEHRARTVVIGSGLTWTAVRMAALSSRRDSDWDPLVEACALHPAVGRGGGPSLRDTVT